MTSNFSLAQKSSIRQNLAPMDITNPAKQLNFAFDNSDEKTNVIITTSNIKKY